MAFYYEIYILLTHHLACEMNVHKRCEQSGCIPKLCGADHTEKRGRIQVKIFFEPKSKDEGRLTIESKILLLLKHLMCLSALQNNTCVRESSLVYDLYEFQVHR